MGQRAIPMLPMHSRATESCEEELNRTKEEFREFVSIAVHDLRGPLRAIGASSELLAGITKSAENERALQCLTFIQEGVGQMDSLLRDIADYWHGEGRPLQLREVNMADALGEAERQVSDELRATDAIITHDPLPDVTGDFLELAMLLRQLISNSCRFRSKDAPRIHVTSIRQGSEWHFSVRDNGIGFKPSYAGTIFQPFKRLHGKQYPGSGLGLPLAKRIVEQHGGRMWVDSVPGEGSTFWFSLPVAE
jgi:light-regulated signal transduction histidine kinase (bacteriophytochrome)